MTSKCISSPWLMIWRCCGKQVWNRSVSQAHNWWFEDVVERRLSVFDAYCEDNVHLRAMLFYTINDFPTYGNLSGYSVKDHYLHPIYEENTSYTQLKHGQKVVYIRHRESSFLIVIVTLEWRKHLMDNRRMRLHHTLQWSTSILIRYKTLILCSERQKRIPLRRTFGRSYQYSLIFHISVN